MKAEQNVNKLFTDGLIKDLAVKLIGAKNLKKGISGQTPFLKIYSFDTCID